MNAEDQLKVHVGDLTGIPAHDKHVPVSWEDKMINFQQPAIVATVAQEEERQKQLQSEARIARAVASYMKPDVVVGKAEDTPVSQAVPLEAPKSEQEQAYEASLSSTPMAPSAQELNEDAFFEASLDSSPAPRQKEIRSEDTRGHLETFMKSHENSKNLPVEKSGWDGTIWRPHKSVEGGSDTLAYGHKLTPTEVKSGRVIVNGKALDYTRGLSDKQADQLFTQDMNKHRAHVTKAFKGVTGKAQDALTAMKYQGVDIAGWKNSSKAVRNAIKTGNESDWLAAQDNILNSLWATSQTPKRALETVHMMFPDTPIEVLEALQKKHMRRRGLISGADKWKGERAREARS